MASQIHPTEIQNKEDSDSDISQTEDVDVFHSEEEKVKYPLLNNIVDNTVFQILVNILTLYALFGDDIRIIAFDKRADDVFDGITIICLIVFSLEIVLASIAKPDYFLSFFFWLDCISTVSQILDLTMFNEAVGLIGSSSAKSASQVAKAGKASRTGSKAARVVRLVRLIRIVKLYKAANNRQEIELKKSNKRSKLSKVSSVVPQQEDIMASLDENQNQPNNNNEQSVKVKESRVSKRLSDSTTKKVIILVLLMLLIMPLFSADYYNEGALSLDYATRYFRALAEVPESTEAQINTTLFYVINQHSSFDTPIGSVYTPFINIPDYNETDYDNLRESSKSYFYLEFDPEKVGVEMKNENIMIFVGDKSLIDAYTSIISICGTLFVCAVLLYGALAFASDANSLVLEPIERMILKVNLIAKNPLAAKEMQLLTIDQQHETTQIENAIIKIGALLALGFGDAGSAIIATNMAKSGDVNPMLPGKRKQAIYGFCDIRNFTDATEVLQKDVMLFVNNIAEIVHSMVDRFGGSANKNIGDAFLLVWKIEDKQFTEIEGVVKWNDMTYINNLADEALFAFMKIFAKINREPKILEYRQDTRLSSRLPGYKVKMGFGLHIGWGIEGAIGSEFKIDASYLSPNVNMASRLEAATKQYGVALLISSDLQELFSPAIKSYTRQVDKVTVKGSIRPIGLFTIDQEAEDLPPSKEDYLPEEKQDVMTEKRLIITKMIEDGTFDSSDFIKRNKDLCLIMKGYNQEFEKYFHSGFEGYLLGNWKEAQLWFEKAKSIKPHDGPCSTLLTVMQEFHFKAPSEWKGYRELTEK